MLLNERLKYLKNNWEFQISILYLRYDTTKSSDELYDFLIRELLDFMKKSSIIAEFIE